MGPLMRKTHGSEAWVRDEKESPRFEIGYMTAQFEAIVGTIRMMHGDAIVGSGATVRARTVRDDDQHPRHYIY